MQRASLGSPFFVSHSVRVERGRSPRVGSLPNLCRKSSVMNTPSLGARSLAGLDMERLLEEHRERIVELEANGIPSNDAQELWDALAGMLAEMKRHQAVVGPDGKFPV